MLPSERKGRGKAGGSCLAFLAALLLLFFPGVKAAGAEEAPVRVDTLTLQEHWEEYDGEEVIFVGEAVGDVMVRGDHAWVTLNDDHYSRRALREAGELRGGNSGIGVWLPRREAEKIGRLGRYGSMGDRVEVRGVFHADCSQHGGDFDIHATSLEVLERGRDLNDSPDSGKYLATVFSLLFLVGASVPLYLRRMAERRSARALLREDAD